MSSIQPSLGTHRVAAQFGRRDGIALAPQAPEGLKRSAAFLDLFERLLISLLFANFAYRMISSLTVELNVATVLLVVGETLPVILIMTRRLTNIVSDRPVDWALGLAGTTAPLLAVPGVMAPVVPGAVCVTVMLLGLGLQIWAKIALARSFGLIAANRGVKMGGPYQFIRHPMYAGYTITNIGFLLAAPMITNGIVYALAFSVQVARVIREERLLNQDERYREFAGRVRYRLIPGIF